MAEDLWKLRKRRNMTVKQLAGKSGVPAASIYEYEKGASVRIADLARLARALFVDEFDIKIQSAPRPTSSQKPAAQRTTPPPTKPKPKKDPKSPSEPMARATQIAHLITLGEKLGLSEGQVRDEVGKPFEKLTLVEVKQWLHDYTERIKAQNKAEKDSRPPDTRRKRAKLPEGVDEFELKYLTARQEAGDIVAFKMLSGDTLTGKIVGFSPYFITVAGDDGTETTIHKLALAYYQTQA